jgi:hypothetical protein
MLIDPRGRPYTSEVHDALSPHLDLLEALVNKDPDTLDIDDYPVMRWQASVSNGSRVFRGGDINTTPWYYFTLSPTDRAMTHNWIINHVDGAKGIHEQARWRRDRHLQSHVGTLLILARNRERYLASPDCPQRTESNGLEIQRFLLTQAWETQMTVIDKPSEPDDVDADALVALEDCMFDDSQAAGEAGNEQWGLDAGDHQSCWNPYRGASGYGDHSPRRKDESESELEVSCLHIFSCPCSPSYLW